MAGPENEIATDPAQGVGGGSAIPSTASSGGYRWVLRLVGGTRLVIVVAVLGLVVAATTLIVYAGLVVAKTVLDLLADSDLSSDRAKHLTIVFVELTDAFLLGAVLLIVALGLFELFVDPELPVPPWLRVRNLDELKGKLVGVIVVLLGVTFLPYVVDWDGRATILHVGLAVAAVIAAFALQTFVAGRRSGEDAESSGER